MSKSLDRARLLRNNLADSPPALLPRGERGDNVHRNVEWKGRLADIDRARAVAASLCDAPPEILHHTDTYFVCPRGRLKLRQIDGQGSQLIAYSRADRAEPRASDYLLVPVADTTALRQALAAALGELVVVEKTREVYLRANVRIHLDRVRSLGTFIEFEAVLDAADDVTTGEAQVRELVARFDLAADDCVAGSYSDLLLAAGA